MPPLSRPHEKAQTLAEFAASKKADRVRCGICKTEKRREVEAERAKGVSYGVIADWLREIHGKGFSEGSVRKHFVHGHHEQKDAR